METGNASPERILDKRMAGYHYSVVCTGEIRPNSMIMTYMINTADPINHNYLLKLMPCVFIKGKAVYTDEFKAVEVEDFPGGVAASFSCEDFQIHTRITPLFAGRGSDSWKGAVLYEVQSEPSCDVAILLGKGYNGESNADINDDSLSGLDGAGMAGSGIIRYTGGRDGINVIISSSDAVTLDNDADIRMKSYIRMKNGAGHILVGFSNNADDLDELCRLDVIKEKRRVERYYEDLLKVAVKTPEPVMDRAFASALYNLEYSWLEPFGWGECLRHWPALWHMQVGAAADLIGQQERSRSCILEHACNLYDNGAVPQFLPNKNIKRDFGGSNQYWIWQVRHYLKCSGDKEFAEYIIPYVDRVISQTLDEYDRDGDNLAAWGLQIGNQEDFVANPYNGAVPSIELHNMFTTRAELSRFIGDHTAAGQWFRRADSVRNLLYKELWMNDLGRFAYYKDPCGMTMPDGQYQTYLYPIIYDIVDEYDMHSGLRHLRDRLTGNDGAVFLSNNFPWHAAGTWGMQCGEAQQPWAAIGLSKAGLGNEAWKPLKAMAEWAQDINHRGAWPEVGPEPVPAYFTPPAGLYIVAVAEALFGIDANVPEGYVGISPSFPDHWPQAKLSLPEYKVSYARNRNELEYSIETKAGLPLRLKWRLPVSRIAKCDVNGTKADYTVKPGMNGIILCIDAPASPKTVFHVEYETVNYNITVPHSVAGGGTIAVSAEGASIERITDRYGVFESICGMTASSFFAKIRTGLLDNYLKFNRLGLLNFSRRSFFLDCATPDGIKFKTEADIGILPRFEACVAGTAMREDGRCCMELLVRNNTDEAYRRDSELVISGTAYGLHLDIAPRSEQLADILISNYGNLLPGENDASVVMPGEAPLDVRFDSGVSCSQADFIPIELPRSDMIPDSSWNNLRVMPGFPHIFFTFSSYGWPVPMEALKDVNEIGVPQIPGLKFVIPGQRFIPVSHLSGNVSYRIMLEPKTYRKLFILVLPFVDNHNMFSPVARVTAYSRNEAVYARTLYYPGDLDYWVPDRNPTSFATFRGPRSGRFGLLPQLKPEMKDWKEGRLPAFPQPEWWATCLPVVTGSCLMNVIEISLKKPENLDFIVFESLGVMPAFGIVAATALC